MRVLRLTGREKAVMRVFDETSGSTGADLVEAAHMEDSEVLDALTSLMNVGVIEAYAPGETLPMLTDVPLEQFRDTRFEVNPSFAQQLRQAMRRS